MNKIVVALAALFVSTSAYADDLSKKTTEMFNPSVQLGNSERGFCSGEIIHSARDEKSGEVETVVLTAKHCVDDKARGSKLQVVKAEYNDMLRKIKSDVYEATVDGKCWKSDVAFIKLIDKNTLFDDVAEVAPKDTKLLFGQETHIVGYPLGLGMTYTKGTLGFVEDIDFGSISKSHEFLRSTPNIAPGSSGSSMFAMIDGKYQIIGVTTGGWNLGTFMNYFTPTDELNDCLGSYMNTLKTDPTPKEDKTEASH